jgi:hypothetical protein
MRKLLILAAVAALSAACHQRSEEEEVGAAPDEGQVDTTAVTHQIDTTRTGPPGVGGRPPGATVTPDSVGVDTAATEGATDTTTMDTTLTATPQDTLGPREPGWWADTAAAQGDTTGAWTDTTAADTSAVNQ